MLTREGHLQTFSAWYPETGEVLRGVQLNREQGEAFGKLFIEKLLSIHENSDMSAQEAMFVENTIQNSSSIIRYLLEAKHYDPPRDRTVLPNLTERAIELVAYADPDVLHAEAWPDSEVRSAVKATGLVAGSVISVSRVPEIRALAEGYAVVATHLLTTLLRDNNGAEVDQYLQEKMQNMIVDYEMVDTK